MKINVWNNCWWVGKTDWELRKFHGDEYSTPRSLMIVSQGLTAPPVGLSLCLHPK
jgi:hypothetical protein